MRLTILDEPLNASIVKCLLPRRVVVKKNMVTTKKISQEAKVI